MRAHAVKHLLAWKTEPEWRDWRWQMRNSIQSMFELLACLPEAARSTRLGGGQDWEAAQAELSRVFHFATTPYYLSLARAAAPAGDTLLALGDDERADCPILAQILPHPVELQDPVHTTEDPLAEEAHMPVRGLTHRYPDRVLWYMTHRCAVYCRFCLRKRKVSTESSAPLLEERAAVLRYITDNPGIKEVILSGGDPLVLSDERLDETLSSLRDISHLASIRIHTRVPVTLPMRITPELGEVLKRHYPLTLVTHFNHARELAPEAAAGVRRLRMAGVTVLNQAVLLRGINDTVADQEELVLGLLRLGVLPYYLHRCDEVRGVSHFRVPLERGVEILAALRGRNPGIALPRYVVDLPGGGGKVALEPEYLLERDERDGAVQYRFLSSNGREYVVRD